MIGLKYWNKARNIREQDKIDPVDPSVQLAHVIEPEEMKVKVDRGGI